MKTEVRIHALDAAPPTVNCIQAAVGLGMVHVCTKDTEIIHLRVIKLYAAHACPCVLGFCSFVFGLIYLFYFFCLVFFSIPKNISFIPPRSALRRVDTGHTVAVPTYRRSVQASRTAREEPSMSWTNSQRLYPDPCARQPWQCEGLLTTILANTIVTALPW